MEEKNKSRRLELHHQLCLLAWKQWRSLRHEKSTTLACMLLPAILSFLSAMNSSSMASTDSIDASPCRVHSFTYCNYPMSVVFQSESAKNVSDVVLDAMRGTAAELGVPFDTFFLQTNQSAAFPFRDGGIIEVITATRATATWFFGQNLEFAQHFETLINQNLKDASSALRFEQIENPYKYEGSAAFDLRVATYLFLLQSAAQSIALEKFTNMYFFLVRVGMDPIAYWMFQFLWWISIGLLSILLSYFTSLIINEPFYIDAFLISVLFHVSLGLCIGAAFKNRKYVSLCTTFLLIFSFIIPIVFSVLISTSSDPKAIEDVFDSIKLIPIYILLGDPSSDAITVGIATSLAFLLFTLYLFPILSVSDGLHRNGNVNYMFPLSPRFWRTGVVCDPSHHTEETLDDANNRVKGTLVFQNCIQHFDNGKSIGPMNLRLSKGQITTLLGPNGVGKSSLIRVAAGFYIPSNGEVWLEDENVFRPSRFSQNLFREISFCPQENYVWDWLTVNEHLSIIAGLRGLTSVMTVLDDGRTLAEHIDWLLNTLGIPDKRNTMAVNLSGGMKRRLCLAMAVLGLPKVILCDEPSSGVDSINQRGIWKVLEEAKKHSAILVTSHSLQEANVLSDAVVNMVTSDQIEYYEPQSCNSESPSIEVCIKNSKDNSTKLFDICPTQVVDAYHAVREICRENEHWHISSKRLETSNSVKFTDLVYLSEGAATGTELSDFNNSTKQSVVDIPQSTRCTPPCLWKQMAILFRVTVFHPDRIGFALTMVIPLNVAFVVLAYFFMGFTERDVGSIGVILPLVPLIFVIAISIMLSNVTSVLAFEKELGVSKLLMSQGISRHAYLLSYFLLYGAYSVPVPITVMVVMASKFGSAGSTIALFFVVLSLWTFVLGVSFLLGAALQPKAAFTANMILPSLLSLYAQGTLNSAFEGVYPGSTGQVIGLLMINEMDSNNIWQLYAMSVSINFIVGMLGFYGFYIRMGNYNPLSTFLKAKKQPPRASIADLEAPLPISQHSQGILQGKNLVKTYAVGTAESSDCFRALDDISFSIETGQLVGLVGKSGAGKSTLMDVLSGQTSLTSGAVYLNNSRVHGPEITKLVSLCGQLDTIWPKMKVSAAIKLFMLCRGYPSSVVNSSKCITEPYVRYLMNELALNDCVQMAVGKLSGGQKRRLAFLVSLLGDTKIVLVDEAMTGVDVDSRNTMWRVLQQEVFKRQRSVVVTTHDMVEIEQFCSSVGILHQGRLVEMGELSEIKNTWHNTIRLRCLVHSQHTADQLVDELQASFSSGSLTMNVQECDVLSGKEGKILITISFDLGLASNLSSLLEMFLVPRTNLLYWVVEPFSLDDFVRDRSRPMKIT